MSTELPEGFKPITLQHIFNLAWQAFIVENKPPALLRPVIGAPECVYSTIVRGVERRCGVGLALPAGHPSLEFRKSFPLLVRKYPQLFDDEIRSRRTEELREFQSGLHDYLVNFSTGEWAVTLDERREKYTDLAGKYKLTVPQGKVDTN